MVDALSYSIVIPEIIVVLFAFLALFSDLKGKNRRLAGFISLAGFTAAILYLFTLRGVEGRLFTFIFDTYAWSFKMLFLFASAIVAATSISYLERARSSTGEYYALLMLATAGAMFVVSARDLITLYVAFETASLSSYALAAYFRWDRRSNEAGLKYFFYGAFSSALILYGLSLIYGLTGSVQLAAISQAISSSPVAYLALAMLIAGFGYKISAVPFHMWTPDVYQGAPTSVTAFLAAVSKAMGVAIFLQIFVLGLGSMIGDWKLVIAVIAAVTMTLGNVVALVQTNVKRMLAYSSIAHAGYALIGIAAFSPLGIAAAIFHMVTHALMKAGSFAIVGEEGDSIHQMNGLWRRSRISAFAMTVFMFSLAGFPPLAGFWSKYWLFWSAIESGLWLLALIGVLNSVISVFYYARVVRAIYVIEPPRILKASRMSSAVVAATVCMAGILIIGVYPQPVIGTLLEAIKAVYP